MDTLMLSRIQFGANIAFHILFPTINIALCWFLVYFRVRNAAAQGTAPAAWRSAARRTGFTPGLIPDTFRVTNRPTFQQVLELVKR